MLSRRDLLAGAVAGSRTAGHMGRHEGPETRNASMTGAPPSPAEAGQLSERNAQDIVQAVRDLRTAITSPHPFTEIQPVRTKQIDFLRAQGKFPDYIEVGVSVWFGVYDWHVRHLQPITLGRDVNGRYALTLLSTNLILRMDADANFVGVPYDAK